MEKIIINPKMRLQGDHLRVVFGCLATRDLKACAVVCRTWHVASTEERRRRTRRLAAAAFAWIEANPGELVLAGSLALWLALGEPMAWFPNSADLFWYGTSDGCPRVVCDRLGLAERSIACKGEIISFLASLTSQRAPKPLVVTPDPSAGPLQFVLSSEFQPAESVLDSFAISCCMVGYTARDTCIKGRRYNDAPVRTFEWLGELDADDVLLVDRHIAGEQAARTGARALDRHIAEEQAARTRARALKYAARGFEINNTPVAATLHQMRFGIAYFYVHPDTYAPSGCRRFQCMLDETAAPAVCGCPNACVWLSASRFRSMGEPL